MIYHVAAPDEYLAITGLGIKGDVKITKSAFVFPFQSCMKFSVQPHDYAMNLQAMTKEKLQFMLPVVFTVGPWIPNSGPEVHPLDPSGTIPTITIDPHEALHRYAILVAETLDQKKSGTHPIEQKIKSIVEGEVRVLVSSMTIEEIFTERELFKRRIHKNIQTELDQFGLRIYNANVKELRDTPESTYFASLSKKAHEGATNQARIDVAEAQLRGNVGEASRHGEEKRQLAQIEADTAVQRATRDAEQQRQTVQIAAETAVLATRADIETAQAEAMRDTTRAGLERDVNLSKVEAQRALESRDMELQRAVEIKRKEAEMERKRAKDVVAAAIKREAEQQAADSAAYAIRAQAEAKAVQVRMAADARLYAAQREAEASLVKTKNEAEAMAAMADAYTQMSQAFGGPQGLLSYLMIEKGTYEHLATANAAAVKGMAPKISLWNTGAGADRGETGEKSGVGAMRNVYQMLPPLMTTIHEQTGITLPEWQFGKLAAVTGEVAGEGGNGKGES